MNSKQIAAVAVVAIVLAAAVTYVLWPPEEGQPGEGPDTPQGYTWTYSSIIGNLPEEKPSPVDDYYTSINYDWLADPVWEDDALSLRWLLEYGKEQVLAITTSDDPMNEVQLIGDIYDAYSSAELRESTYRDEIRLYIDPIMNAETIQDLSDYLTGQYVVYNPLMGAGMDVGSDHTTLWTKVSVFIGITEFTDMTGVDSQLMTALTALYLGSEEETAAMSQAVDELLMEAMEGIDMTDPAIATDFHEMTAEEVSERYTNLPMVDMIEALGFQEDSFLVGQPEIYDGLDATYTDENLEAYKALFLRYALLASCQYLGGEYLDLYLQAKADGMTLEEASGEFLNETSLTLFPYLLDTAFNHLYYNEGAARAVNDLYEEIKGVYSQRIAANEWMGDETKASALEKIDQMDIHIGGARYAYYSDFVLPSTTEAGGLLADYVALQRGHNALLSYHYIGYDIQDTTWMGVYGQSTSAAYNPLNNAVYVTAQYISEGGMWSDGLSVEALYAAFGSVLGHEISHGFDTNGSRYDAGGYLVNWWTDEDNATFQSLVQDYKDLIASITLEPGYVYDPDHLINEAVADLGGMSVLMEMAGAVEGFDYEAFFGCYADLWRRSLTAERAEELVTEDVHPPDMMRVNMIIINFQQFHDAVGVSEGDGMWLAPEDRISIW